jgi:hypothetical protein
VYVQPTGHARDDAPIALGQLARAPVQKLLGENSDFGVHGLTAFHRPLPADRDEPERMDQASATAEGGTLNRLLSLGIVAHRC